MKKLMSIAIILVTVFALMIPTFASAYEEIEKDMWVNCANGKKLNVREEPVMGSGIITRLECGTKVHVDYSCGNGWVAVSDYHFSGYVQASFLVSSGIPMKQVQLLKMTPQAAPRTKITGEPSEADRP